MDIRCPFLKEEKVAFCRAFPIKKMLPFDKLYLKDNLCFKKAHLCTHYQERGEKQDVAGKVCPFLEVGGVIYCEVYPVKKMIPASCFKLECPCTTERYVECPAYKGIAQGDLSCDAVEVSKVRGFLFDDTMYHHKGHLWLQRLNGKLRVGVDDFAQWLLGEVEEITIPSQGSRVRCGHTLVRLRCVQGTAEISSPVSGTVVGVNKVVAADRSVINTDPYGQGWLVEMQPAAGEAARLGQGGFLCGSEARRWLEAEVDQLYALVQTEVGVTMSDGGEPIRDLKQVVGPHQWSLLIETFLQRKED